jgi:hypothetical protein
VTANDQDRNARIPKTPRKENAPGEFHFELIGDTVHVRGTILARVLVFNSCFRSVFQSHDARNSEILHFFTSRRFLIRVNGLAAGCVPRTLGRVSIRRTSYHVG